MREFLTVSDLAEYIRFHKVTIWRMAHKGILPGFKIGGSWRFRRSTVEEWLKNNEDVMGTWRK